MSLQAQVLEALYPAPSTPCTQRQPVVLNGVVPNGLIEMRSGERLW